MYFGSNSSAKAAAAGATTTTQNPMIEAHGISNSVKASLAYYGLATGAYGEPVNEIGPFLNTSSLQKSSGNTTSSNVSNAADYEIAQGLAANAQQRFVKLMPMVNNPAIGQKVSGALAGLVSFKNAIDNKAPFNLVQDQANSALSNLQQAFNLK
jgi:hypothetical protein